MGLGGQLLDVVASRVIARYLRSTGAAGVMMIDPDADPLRLADVDVVYSRDGGGVRAKVKPDPYFGSDPGKIADQDLPFYRESLEAYAFETISHHITREPGWMFHTVADELLYYFVAIDQSEREVAALMNEDDETFFSDLSVTRDELHVLPMAPLKEWFEANQDNYMPRPVRVGDHSGWYRIVPVADVARAVPVGRVAGPIFAGLKDP